MIKRAFVIVIACALAACGGGPRPIAQSPSIQRAAQDVLPAPDRTDMVTGARPYFIGPFDKLTISVFGIEELSDKEVQTDAGGRVSFPLIGVIDAAGKTPDELADVIAERLAGRFVRNPQVTVNLQDTVSQIVTVDGQVVQPGLYPVIGNMTLIKAIATAKGPSEYAKLDDVVVFRTVRGQRLAALYNLSAIRRGNYPDPEIFANDVIVVGDSPARRLFRDLLEASPLLTTPIIALINSGAI